MLSQAVEDYLKAIFKLEEDAPVNTNLLAQTLGVAPASATKMAQRLDRMGLASYEAYRGVRLTASGKKIALEIIRHHRLLETYLKEVMNYPWDKIHDEAEQLEHHISEEFEDKIDALLGYPTHDPHGDPIPDRDGTMVLHDSVPLSSATPGSTLTVRTLLNRDPRSLEHLEQLGLLPSTTLSIVKLNEDGSVSVKTDESVTLIESEVADSILVSVRM